MNNQIIRIPIDKTKFNNDKMEKAEIFLNDFFSGFYKCSFVYDDDNDDVLCLQILKAF